MALGKTLRSAREARGLSTSEAAARTRIKVQIIEDLENEDFRRVAAPIYGKGFIKIYAELLGVDPEPLIEDYVERFVAPAPDQRIAVQPMSDSKHVKALAEKPEPADEERAEAAPEQQPAEPDLFSAAGRQMPRRAKNRRKAGNALDQTRKLAFAVGCTALEMVRRGRASSSGLYERMCEQWRARSFSLPPLEWREVDFTQAPLKTLSVGFGVVLLIVLVVSGLSQCVSRRPAGADRVPPIADGGLRPAIELPEPYLD
jgi:transcriptional regulator with XRE-family HTH domain